MTHRAIHLHTPEARDASAVNRWRLHAGLRSSEVTDMRGWHASYGAEMVGRDGRRRADAVELRLAVRLG